MLYYRRFRFLPVLVLVLVSVKKLVVPPGDNMGDLIQDGPFKLFPNVSCLVTLTC